MENKMAQVVLVKDINPGIDDYGYAFDSNPANFIEFDDKLYFTADNAENGHELWVSDGTSTGTQLLLDINSDISNYGYYPYDSNASNFIEFDDKLYFTADDGENGHELWVSDGTPTGTQLLLNINPEYSYYYDNYLNINSNPSDFIEFDDKLYFTADDGKNGNELWVSDGTATGTQLLLDINPRIIDYGHFEAPYAFSSTPSNFMEFDDKLYFTADDGEHGNELWVSDGTPTGTKLLLDINPGISGSYPQNFTESNDKLYLTAYDDENGLELWVSDGTSTGTQILLDIDPGIGNYGGSYPYNLIQFDGKLYFTANDGENGHELWVSDGTPTGTQLLLDINPGISDYGGYTKSSYPSNFIESDGKLYFTADDGENGRELWVSDGTSTGTQLLLDINPARYKYIHAYSSYPSNFIEFDGKLYFTANDGVNSNELWVSDGTPTGTQLLLDIDPGISNPSDFIEFDDKLYFTADDGENGRELWVSDGTTAGTKSLVDMNLGDGSLIVVDDELFLNANDPITGDELYKLTFDDSDPDITYITGTNSPDHLVGGDGVDQITGLSGNDVLGGKAGNDILHGGKGNDALFGADGQDILTGDDGNDILRGQSGKDVLNGSDGNDTLFGGNQFDRLSGGNGDDVLDDIQGITIYNGGTGSDIFVIHNDAQTDWIQDFELGIDRIRLADGITFGQLEITGHVNSFLSFQGEQIGVLLGVSPNDLNTTMVEAVFLTNL